MEYRDFRQKGTVPRAPVLSALPVEVLEMTMAGLVADFIRWRENLSLAERY